MRRRKKWNATGKNIHGGCHGSDTMLRNMASMERRKEEEEKAKRNSKSLY